MANGIAKNLERVKEGLAPFIEESKEQTEKIKQAGWRLDRVAHHASGYLEAGLQHLYKLWFYTWLPKWLVVGYLIF